MSVHLDRTFYGTRAAVERMAPRRAGAIVNMASNKLALDPRDRTVDRGAVAHVDLECTRPVESGSATPCSSGRVWDAPDLDYRSAGPTTTARAHPTPRDDGARVAAAAYGHAFPQSPTITGLR
jgi:hypothetical protein